MLVIALKRNTTLLPEPSADVEAFGVGSVSVMTKPSATLVGNCGPPAGMANS